MVLADTLVWGKPPLFMGSALSLTAPQLGYLRSLQLGEALTLRIARGLGTVTGRQAGTQAGRNGLSRSFSKVPQIEIMASEDTVSHRQCACYHLDPTRGKHPADSLKHRLGRHLYTTKLVAI